MILLKKICHHSPQCKSFNYQKSERMEKTHVSKKIQVLLTDEQFTVLQRVARRQKKKLGTVLWESFETLHMRTQRTGQDK